MPDVKHFDPEQVLDQVVELFWRQGEAPTGIEQVVSATGLSRSSLYATFGGKRDLYAAALRRYVDQRSRPVLDALAADRRGLPAIAGFFHELIEARCAGAHARWGCMVANAHTGSGLGGAAGEDAQVRQVLDEHHTRLGSAMRSALQTARRRSQTSTHLDVEATAELLALLAYAVNLRSRAGAAASDLKVTVAAALEPLRGPKSSVKEM